jgi:hypothetical protein
MMPSKQIGSPRPWMTAICLALALVLAGCGPAASIQMRSIHAPDRVVAPTWRTMVANVVDDNTVDVYLSDIPLERFESPTDTMSDVEGQIVQLHIFMRPKAGRTPIADTACNATIRHLILTPRAAGEYGGGIFIMPTSDVGDASYTATVFDGQLKLLRSAGAFEDRLGVAALRGSLRVPHDPKMARTIEKRVETLRFRRFGPAATGSEGI